MRYHVFDETETNAGGSSSALDQSVDRGEPVNLARSIGEKVNTGETFYSYELFPTKNEVTHQRFFIETQSCAPLFYALTWHEEPNEHFLALKCAEKFSRNTLLHCAAKGLKRADIEKILNKALELGIYNVFALRGDLSANDEDFKYASDLVIFIRERFGEKFSICVAGYPEMHPNSPSKEHDLFYLKAKVDAGADFIITQFFFDSQMYIQFVKDCRKIGISVPIIPGIFPFTTVKSLKRMAMLCETSIPTWMENKLQEIGDNEESVKKFGIDLSVKLIQEIRNSGTFNGYHLYTLNKSFSAIEIHRQLGDTKENSENLNE